MSKRLDRFTRSFQASAIPFLLAEVLTNGAGEMVDLVFRFLNAPAAALLDVKAEDLTGQRFTRAFPSGTLAALAPLGKVAFSGSSAAFSYTTALGRPLKITCYQPMYGLAACLLEAACPAEQPAPPPSAPEDRLPGVPLTLALRRGRLRNLAFSPRLCEMTGYSQKAFLNRFSDDFSALVTPEDWPALLQHLMDALREGRPLIHTFRLVCREAPLWAELRTQAPFRQEGAAVFRGILLDVDRQQRERLRLEEELRRLESARDRSVQLLERMPGSMLLIQFPPEGPGRPIWASPRAEALLGLSVPELALEIPVFLVLPTDREALIQTVRQARSAEEPFRCAFRIRRKDGALVWLELQGRFQPQHDGGALLYAALEDVTQRKRQEAELRQFREFTDLLLHEADLVTLDYNPAEDSARIERPRPGGGRETERIEGYLVCLKDRACIHPADRRAVSAALRQMAEKPGMETFLFRSCRPGQGWRTYQATCAPIFDRRGNVYRIMGKAVDVTARLAAAERYRELCARQKRLTREALAAARLDLTANRILDARGAGRHMTRSLFGNTAEDCLAGIRDNLPLPGEREAFARQFCRDTLLDAFRRGSTHFGLSHHITVGSGVILHARSMLELAENPETRQTEAFFAVVNTEPEHLKVRTLEALLQKEGRTALAVRPSTGRCTPLLGDCPDAYADLSGPSLEEVLAALEQAPRCVRRTGGQTFTFSWLDATRDLLLVTIQ